MPKPRRRIDPKKLCTHIKEDGVKCKIYLAKDSDRFCHLHRPFDDFECPVCYTTVDNQSNSCILPDCKHKFCTTCITSWFKKNKLSCPCCRGVIPNEFITEYDPNFFQRQRLPAIHLPWSYIPPGTAEYQLNYLRQLSDYIAGEVAHLIRVQHGNL